METHLKICHYCSFKEKFLLKMMVDLRAQDEGARGAFDWQLYYKREN